MLLLPDIKLDRITELTPEMLKRRGVKALVLDVDNTMSTHHGQQLTAGLTEWLQTMRDSEIRLTILSNACKRRLVPFAARVGLDFISLGLKPLPFGYLRAVRRLKVQRSEAAIVGDQIFTDTLGGNLAGLKTVLLTPILSESSLRFRLKRRLERAVIKRFHIEKTEE